MPASASVVVTLKTLFSVLACVMVATLLWAIATDGLVSCVDLRARWLAVALINFYINAAFIGAWFVYKESSWIKEAILIILEIVFGSIGTCVYIVRQLFYLSPQQHVSLVLLNNKNMDFSSSDPLLVAHVDV
ncbi:hypothetical protein L2E82_22755 [Cichorium intybus]|uniref:Uncharacterized protein n=1 Tax=Cichorium intybus TaxID=13427 RepID=A0ACB9DYA1_CICIN|nr:hypothetical protein L2E82_22755 [Cichorium intybus]